MPRLTRRPPALTSRRVRLAYGVAITADVLAWALGPFGWAFIDEILDVVAAAILWRTIGFHPLLLPTFVIELLPIADLLPTWTGCVALVIAQRKRRQQPMGHEPGEIIDV